jgi:hypothetical protein
MLILSTLFYHLMLICKLPCRVPQDIASASPAKNIAPMIESPKVDKPPIPSARKTFPAMSKPPGPEEINASTGASRNPTSSLQPTQDVTLLTHPQGQNLLIIKKHQHRILSLLDLGHVVDHKLVGDHLCQCLRSNRTNIHMLQSPCGRTQISSRLVITSADT